MGHRAQLGMWLARALLLCVTALAIYTQFRVPSRHGGRDVVTLTSRLLSEAGFRVHPLSRSWSNGTIVSTYALRAHHPGCVEDVIVEALPADSGDESEIVQSGDPSLFVFGMWTGSKSPSRIMVIKELSMMYVRPLITGRYAPRPKRLLQVIDPSSCLILNPVDWTKIWYGFDKFKPG